MASNYLEFHINEFDKSITYLRSFNSVVAKYDHFQGRMTLGRDWDFSMTTITHIGRFIDRVMGRDIHGRTNIQKALDIHMFDFDKDMK